MLNIREKKSNLIAKIISIFALLIIVGIGSYFLFRNGSSDQKRNLGEQQRQQIKEAAGHLIENILDNQSNFDRLTINPSGARKNIDEIENLFLSNTFAQPSQSGNQPILINNSLSPEIIEQAWYELRPFIDANLKNPNQSLLESAWLKIRNDIEKWIRQEIETTKGDYNTLLEQNLRLIQGLKTIKELFEQYNQIRTNLVINKVNRKDELIAKGYSDKDIEQLKEWNLLEPDFHFPDLYNNERIGVTNTLSVLSRESYGGEREIIGGRSAELLLFLRPHRHHSSETTINFPPDKVSESQQNSVRQIINNLLQNSQKLGQQIRNYDVYILRLNASNTTYTGPSSGVAHYLALYSALHQIPLPRNLASTATIEGDKVGAIGGLKYKLEAATSKKNPIDTFILSTDNKKNSIPEQSWDDIPCYIKTKTKQAHFISQVEQIEVALQEILKEPNRKVVHICGENPKEPRESPINTEITPEKFLSLIVEYYSRDETTEARRDFRSKLLASVMKNFSISRRS